jgi:hypothetical protein
MPAADERRWDAARACSTPPARLFRDATPYQPVQRWYAACSASRPAASHVWCAPTVADCRRLVADLTPTVAERPPPTAADLADQRQPPGLAPTTHVWCRPAPTFRRLGASLAPTRRRLRRRLVADFCRGSRRIGTLGDGGWGEVGDRGRYRYRAGSMNEHTIYCTTIIRAHRTGFWHGRPRRIGEPVPGARCKQQAARCRLAGAGGRLASWKLGRLYGAAHTGCVVCVTA